MTVERFDKRTRTRFLGGARQSPSSAREIDRRLASLDARIHQFKLRMAGMSDEATGLVEDSQDA